jgi:iron transport multicopper oxidase
VVIEQGATLQQYYLYISSKSIGLTATNYIKALPGNPNALEPVPVSALMNDQEQPTFPVEPNKTYYLRIINMSGYAQFYLHIDGHNMTIVEADGVYSMPQTVEDLYIATGQRYGVLLKTKPTRNRNFGILGAMDLKGFPGSAAPPPHPNVTGALLYNRMDSPYFP